MRAALLLGLALPSAAATAPQACEVVALSGEARRTPCDARQCTPAVAWPADKLQRLDQRLGSLD